MKRISAALILATLSVAPSFADGGPVLDPSKADGGKYAIDPYHVMVTFSLSHFGFSTFYGRFSTASADLTFDPKKPAASTLSVSVPTASISTQNDKLNGELVGADWFDATKFPEITFKATKITVTGAKTGKITGDLTLHGVTKPVTLLASFNAAGTNPVDKKYTIGFEAHGVVNRTAFGITKYAPYIGDNVNVTISAPFEKAN